MTTRLIFTVTTGRSGTGFLTRLLDMVPRLTSVHEPAPNFVSVMREAQTDPEVAKRFWVEQKLPAIQRLGARLYCETSHLASKGFLEPLLELGHRPDLILLRRPHREVATSLYLLGAIPGRTPGGLRWYLSPEDPGVLELPGWQELEDYQLCYWYCLEVERRRVQYGARFRALGARVAEVELAELNTLAGFVRLCTDLGLAPRLAVPHVWWRFARRNRGPANEKHRRKRDVQLPASLDALEAQVDERVAQAAIVTADRGV